MKRFNKKQEVDDAEKLLDGIETWESLSQMSLEQLCGLQRLLGYVIEEKLNESKEFLKNF